MVHFCGSLGTGFSSGILLRDVFPELPSTAPWYSSQREDGALHLGIHIWNELDQTLLFKQETFRGKKISNSRA